MGNFTSKSVEYSDSIQDMEYLVKALIVSAPEELEIKNMDEEENKGFIFTISILIEPDLPQEFLLPAKNLIFIIGKDGLSRLVYIANGNFMDIAENTFNRRLKVNILEVLLIEGNSGHFKS
jgi:hypothetical protein